MHISIKHSIRYTYSREVFLEPQMVRMQPRSCGSQVLESFQCDVRPTPVGRSHCLDAEGNNALSIWFEGKYRQLSVTARSRVRTRRTNPFDFLLNPDLTGLPLRYEPSTAEALVASRTCTVQGPALDDINSFVAEVLSASGHQLLPFLDELNRKINRELECIRRDEGDAWPPSRTLTEGQGACRDLTVVFMEACRSVGIAARFVSGYQTGDAKQPRRDLHAWAEAYVPAGGWRGYDPTLGLAVADDHVVVASAAEPQNAAALLGSFRGTGAVSLMEATIELRFEGPDEISDQAQQQQQASP